MASDPMSITRWLRRTRRCADACDRLAVANDALVRARAELLDALYDAPGEPVPDEYRDFEIETLIDLVADRPLGDITPRGEMILSELERGEW
jgi:hypothetical protein